MSVSSSATDPVQTVIELLDGYTGWSLDSPEVYNQNEISQQERTSNPDPAIYVWSPVDASIEQFSADNDSLLETRTIEASVWTLDNSDTFTYHREAVDFLQEYADDNYATVNFHHIQPNSVTDSRSEKIARQTDHYVMSIQAEVEDLR